MSKEIIEKAKAMLADGLNMNQVAAILSVDRLTLSTALLEKPKVTKVKTETLFPDEPGL